MKKRFIVLIDFSKGSSNLLSYAYDWSKQNNAELLLVHQLIVIFPSFTDNVSRESLSQHAQQESLNKMKELAKATLPTTDKVSYLVSENHIKRMLMDLANEDFENIIFVGSKEVGLIKKMFFDSMAIQVIENTKNIVVAMPKEIDSFSHERIFVAVTDKHPINILELNNFFRFLDKSKTQITFFYLGKPDEEIDEIEKQLKDLTKLFAERYHTGYAIYEGRDALTDIKKVINNKIDEILIVQKGSRLLTDQIFRRFLINELVNEGQTPLVVLPE